MSKNGVTLKTRLGIVQGHWKWRRSIDHMQLSIGPHTSSYSPSIVTMAISCIVCEIYRLIGRKPRNFYAPPVFSARAVVDTVGIPWICLIKQNDWATVWWKKLWRYVKPFSSDTGTSRTDTTDRRTHRFAISISRVSMLTRDKTITITFTMFCISLF